jgi:hypothetical protein
MEYAHASLDPPHRTRSQPSMRSRSNDPKTHIVSIRQRSLTFILSPTHSRSCAVSAHPRPEPSSATRRLHPRLRVPAKPSRLACRRGRPGSKLDPLYPELFPLPATHRYDHGRRPLLYSARPPYAVTMRPRRCAAGPPRKRVWCGSRWCRMA